MACAVRSNRNKFQHKFFRQPQECLAHMYENEIACDVTLKVQGQEIRCHKVILSAHSSVFYDIFEKDHQNSEVNIDYIKYDVMKPIISFIYTDKIDISNETCIEFMHAAKMFDFHEISQLCTDLLVSSITANNILHYLNLAVDFENEALKTKCLKVFTDNTAKVLSDEQFADISYEALYLLMSCEVVTGCSEVELFQDCRRWARAECRRHHIPVASNSDIRNVLGDILQLINFKAFDFTEVKQVIGVLDQSDEIEIYKYLSLPQEIRNEPDSILTLTCGCRDKPRSIQGNTRKPLPHNIPKINCKKCHKRIDTDVCCEWVVCGECLTVNFCLPCSILGCHHEHAEQLQVFVNKGMNKCCSLCGQPTRKTAVTCDQCADFTMCPSCLQAGLHKHHQDSLQVFKELQSYIMLIGGCSAGQAVSSCNVYDCEGKQLKDADKVNIPDLPEGIMFAALVETDDHIFLIGGRGAASRYKRSCLCFDKSAMTWKKLADMNEAREGCIASILDGKILVVGGYKGKYLPTVEIYDVNQNQWRKMADYPAGGVGFAASCAWNGAYYVSGGHNGDKILNNVYRYKPDTATWQPLANLVTGRYQHSMAAVGEHLYVLGGYNVTSVEMYSETTRQFTQISNFPVMKYYTNAVIIKENIVLAGGNNEDIITFNTQTKTVTQMKMELHRKYGQSHVAVIKW